MFQESIESASGILKYVSQYLTNHSDHSDLRPHLVKALVLHLSSSSFTALSNVLGAIGNLIAKDPHVQVGFHYCNHNFFCRTKFCPITRLCVS